MKEIIMEQPENTYITYSHIPMVKETNLIEKQAGEFGLEVCSKENGNWIVKQLAILCHQSEGVTCISLLLKLFEV